MNIQVYEVDYYDVKHFMIFADIGGKMEAIFAFDRAVKDGSDIIEIVIDDGLAVISQSLTHNK